MGRQGAAPAYSAGGWGAQPALAVKDILHDRSTGDDACHVRRAFAPVLQFAVTGRQSLLLRQLSALFTCISTSTYCACVCAHVCACASSQVGAVWLLQA